MTEANLKKVSGPSRAEQEQALLEKLLAEQRKAREDEVSNLQRDVYLIELKNGQLQRENVELTERKAALEAEVTELRARGSNLAEVALDGLHRVTLDNEKIANSLFTSYSWASEEHTQYEPG